MSEEKPYFQLDQRAQIRSWVAGEMARGAGQAALVLTLILVTLYVIYGIGLLLPAESKQAPSPYPNAGLSQPFGDYRLG